MNVLDILSGQRKFKGLTQREIAYQLNCSERATQKQISSLQRYGLIEKAQVKRTVFTIKKRI